MTEVKHFAFRGVKIDNLSYQEIIEKIDNNLRCRKYICLLEASGVIISASDNELLNAINKSLISIPDGMPLAWYGKLLGSKKIMRISGVELMKRLFEEKTSYKHYLLGDTEQTIARVIEKAKRNNKDLRITGHSPPFKNKFSNDDNKLMLQKINKENPDIIWVSFGLLKQEKWMYHNVSKVNRGIMIGVGAAFRFYIGDIKIPHETLQKLGLQWFFRFIDNPSRYLRAGALPLRLRFIIYFPFEIIKAKKMLRKKL